MPNQTGRISGVLDWFEDPARHASYRTVKEKKRVQIQTKTKVSI